MIQEELHHLITTPTTYRTIQRFINYRLGFEHFDNLSAKFQVFYGIDLYYSGAYNRTDAQYWNGGYANGNETKTTSFGVAPLLGIRFKLNKRLSLLTESSFAIGRNNSWQKRFYIPVNGTYPALPDDPKAKSNSITTSFNFPLFVVMAVTL